MDGYIDRDISYQISYVSQELFCHDPIHHRSTFRKCFLVKECCYTGILTNLILYQKSLAIVKLGSKIANNAPTKCKDPVTSISTLS